MQLTLSTVNASFGANTKTFNKEVDVNAFYFKQRSNKLASFPKQMELDGAQYYFADNGLRYLVRKGAQIIQLFDVTDGRNTFRLRRNGDEWRLISMKQGEA